VITNLGEEFAVVDPSLINAVKEIGIGLSEAENTSMVPGASMSVTYGESLNNLL